MITLSPIVFNTNNIIQFIKIYKVSNNFNDLTVILY